MAHSTELFLKLAHQTLATCYTSFNEQVQSFKYQDCDVNSDGGTQSSDILICTVFEFMKCSFFLKYNTRLFLDAKNTDFLISTIDVLIHYMQFTSEQVIEY